MNLYERLFFSHYVDEGEKLLYTMHRHWVVVFQKMMEISFFGILIPIGVLFFFFRFDSPVAYVLYVWMVIGFIASMYTFTDWYADAWLLTDRSIIDVRWDGFFKRSAQRIGYESIESVVYEVKGVKATLLNYGVLTITNESGNVLEIKKIRNPRKAEAKLTEIQGQLSQQSGQDNLEALKDLLADVIEDRLNKSGKGR
jgi:hypothetical protein